MANATFIVEGMTCGHCVKAVSEEVAGVAGVQRVDIDLAGKTMAVDADVIDVDALRAAVEEAGYTLVGPAPTS